MINKYVLKQAIMKLDAFIQDICELKNEDSEDREALELIAEHASIIEVKLLNMYKSENGDDDTLNEMVMDTIEEFPFSDSNEGEDIFNIKI